MYYKKNSRETYEFCEICHKPVLYKMYPYCETHYYRMKKYGDPNKRTAKDKNEIIEYDKFSEIILYDKQQNEIAKVKISNDMVDLVKSRKWYLNSNGYAMSYSFNEHVLLHRFITSASSDVVVDHINRDKLDCRSENLRFCTSSNNSMNSSMKSNNTSGVIGVWLDTRFNPTWVAEIFADGKKISLGRSKYKSKAIKLRKDAEIKYFGEFTAKENTLNG